MPAEPSEWAKREAEALLKIVERELREYRCQHTEEWTGGGLSLVDALTPPGEDSVKLGLEEVELLIDAVGGELLPALLAALDAARSGEQRLREAIAKVADREERYGLDAVQREDDGDCAMYGHTARALRSLLDDDAPEAGREEGHGG